MELDAWLLNELPNTIRSRSPSFMNQSEVSKLMSWKLTKGKWRPKLQMYVDALHDNDVIEATKQAFAQCDEQEWRQAFKHVTELKGIGPATASAILSAYDPAIPFMAEYPDLRK